VRILRGKRGESVLAEAPLADCRIVSSLVPSEWDTLRIDMPGPYGPVTIEMSDEEVARLAEICWQNRLGHLSLPAASDDVPDEAPAAPGGQAPR
jgi:hypothetical protein